MLININRISLEGFERSFAGHERLRLCVEDMAMSKQISHTHAESLIG